MKTTRFVVRDDAWAAILAEAREKAKELGPVLGRKVTAEEVADRIAANLIAAYEEDRRDQGNTVAGLVIGLEHTKVPIVVYRDKPGAEYQISYRDRAGAQGFRPRGDVDHRAFYWDHKNISLIASTRMPKIATHVSIPITMPATAPAFRTSCTVRPEIVPNKDQAAGRRPMRPPLIAHQRMFESPSPDGAGTSTACCDLKRIPSSCHEHCRLLLFDDRHIVAAHRADNAVLRDHLITLRASPLGGNHCAGLFFMVVGNRDARRQES